MSVYTSEFKIQVYTDTYPYVKVGEVGSYQSCRFTLRHNAVGAWAISLGKSDHAVLELAQANRRITVDYNGERIQSGAVYGVRRAMDGRKVTNEVYGYDDKQFLARRLAHPNPLRTYPADGTSFDLTGGVANTRDYITDNVETMVKYWVTRNAVTRLPIPGLVVAADLGRGPVKAYGPRWEPLIEAVTNLSNVGGLGYSMLQSGDHLVFDVYEPQVRPVRLSENLDNLRAWAYVLEAPAATRMVLGGAGENTTRRFMQKKLLSSEALWGITETFADATDAENDTELSARGDELLAEAAATVGFSITPEDSVGMRFGQHYSVGDKVQVEVADNVFVPDVVTEVVLEHSAGSAPRSTPTVGNADTSQKSNALYRKYKGLLQRILRTERNR